METKPLKLYNVIFPIWILMFWPSPPVILLTLLGNLAIDCLVVFLALCLGLPALLGLLDAPDVPVLRGLLFPWLLLPVGCFFSGLSLGRRKGFCPLYPLVCALAALAAVFWVYNSSALPYCAVALGCSLAGDLAGAALRGVRN